MIRKRFFTLLEILIVLAILTLIGSFGAFNMHKAYQEQAALNEMNQVVHLYNTTSDLMTLVNLDSEIRFAEINGKLQMELIPKSGVSPLIIPLIPKGPIVFDHIKEINFKDAYQETVLTPPFSLVMLSKGFLMNRGVLNMKSKNVISSFILYGYPSSVSLIKGSFAKYPEDKSLQDLIQKITEQTRMETQ